MSAEPGMVEIRNNAPAGIMERYYPRAVVIQIRVGASQVADRINCARQTIDALVVAWQAGSRRIVIGTVRRISQCAEIIIERMIFLHDDDDVVDFLQAIGESQAWPDERKKKKNCKRQSP